MMHRKLICRTFNCERPLSALFLFTEIPPGKVSLLSPKETKEGRKNVLARRHFYTLPEKVGFLAGAKLMAIATVRKHAKKAKYYISTETNLTAIASNSASTMEGP